MTVCIVLSLVRYYLKNNMETETLCSDEDAQELLRESQISLLQLSTLEVSAQLSIRDFGIFRNIESTEYVDSLFKLNSSNGHLKQFEDLINEETFWVATEILHEPNALKRMKTIKHFIKIALQCRECKNFNSMFAIIRWVNYNCYNRCCGHFCFILANFFFITIVSATLTIILHTIYIPMALSLATSREFKWIM